jgi:hypothetical protein
MQIRTWLKHKIKSPDTPFLVVLFAVFCVVVATNFPWGGKWMTGWDNLHPEFNFFLNFKRAFEGVWQSNEGLGLVGGHGYAATLPHTLFLWLLSFILPINSLRSIFTFLMLFIGSLGTYFLTKNIISKLSNNQQPITNNQQLASLFAGLFTMLNIGTVQNFYIQLEAFIVHFAFLPWLILTLWQYLEHPSKKSFWQFILINIFILPAGFIPPLFVVQALLVALSLLVWINHAVTMEKIKRSGVVVSIIFCVNAFWLLPFTYYTLTHSQNYLNAYNNLQSTQDFISKNQKYGDISDVALIKSFLFDANDVTKDGNLVKILAPWVEHFNNPLVRVFGYAVFVMSIIGTVYLLTCKHNRKNNLAVVAGFILIFLLLATGTPPFSWVTQWLRSHSPLFEQAFRVAFTKFSVAYGMHLAVIAGIGLYAILSRIKTGVIKTISIISIGGLLVFYAWPGLNGNFLYKTTKIAIPNAYFELFDYMKTQPTDGRIMNLPQGWNWGWALYKWGYSGSGFLWYGIEQPVMDRAFDVWSPYNENYYWELVHALYAKDWKQFEAIVEKYYIRWILYDPSVIPIPGGKWIFYSQNLEEYLSSNPKYNLTKEFGDLKLFSVNLVNSPNDNILVYDNLLNVLPSYKWNGADSALNITSAYKSDILLPADYFYPYRSLFTNRKVNQREFEIAKTISGYNLSPVNKDGGLTGFTKTSQLDPFIPVKIKLQGVSEKDLVLEYSFIYPNNRPSFEPARGETRTIKIPKGQTDISISLFGERLPLATDGKPVFTDKVILDWWETDSQIVVYGNDNAVIDYFTLPKPVLVNNSGIDDAMIPFVSGSSSYDSTTDPDFLSHKLSDCKNVQNTDQPVIWDDGKKVLKFVSSSEDQCYDIVLQYLRQDTGYLVEVESKNIKGKPLQFAFINKQVEKTDFELPLSSNTGYQSAYFIIPPMQFDGLGYSLHFTNKATGVSLSENLLRTVRVTPIPYTYLSTLRYENGGSAPVTDNSVNVKTIASYLYQIKISNKSNNIVLSQSYDDGWLAYYQTNSFPFFRVIKNHFLVNNWANGWEIGDNVGGKTIYIFFFPQILEWIGFGLLIIPIVGLLRFPKR